MLRHMDAQRLKDNFARVAAHGDQVALFFYSHLFLAHPEVRDMFPVSMAVQRDRLVNALGQIVSTVGDSGAVVPFLRGLGRDHRKFGTAPEHYPAVGESLIATLRHFSGDDWNDELAGEWAAAYGVIADVMTQAAAEDAGPARWEATIVSHERRTADVAVLRVLPDQPLDYQPGQAVALECEERPRVWRYYSMANAPREDGTLDFHVRAAAGGVVSTVLVLGTRSRLRLGAPVGTFTFDPASGRDVVMAAGGTGLAPVKAILEQISALDDGPDVRLFFGARTADGLYDLPDLEKMAADRPWLTVTAAVSAEADYRGERGTIADVIARYGPWRDRDAYVCGTSAMVTATVSRLEALGTAAEQVHVEDFGLV
jgi:NAD(P)H-flavin reductase/hemoglobin-like flavoprotein